MDSDSPLAKLFNNNALFNSNNSTVQLREGEIPFGIGFLQTNNNNDNNPTAPEQTSDSNNDPTVPAQANGNNDNQKPVENSTLFSDYVRLMQSDPAEQSRRRLLCECAICYNVNDISKTEVGEPYATLPQGNPEYGGILCETGLLPCGHLVGWNCLRQMTVNADICPICRQTVECAKCKQLLALPCVRRLPDGKKRIGGDAPLPAGDGPDGRPKKIYCRDCVLRQTALLLNVLFAGTEMCPLCVPGSEYHRLGETLAEHRNRRVRTAQRYFEMYIDAVAELAYPLALDTMWDQERAARLRVWFKGKRKALADDLRESPYAQVLYRRIFGNCPRTKERAGPVTQRDVIAMTLLAVEIAPKCKEIMDGTLAWYTDLDRWMNINVNLPMQW